MPLVQAPHICMPDVAPGKQAEQTRSCDSATRKQPAALPHLHSASRVASFCAAAPPLSRTISWVSSLGAAAAASAASLQAGQHIGVMLEPTAHNVPESISRAIKDGPCKLSHPPKQPASGCCRHVALNTPPDRVLERQGHQLLHFLSHGGGEEHGLAAHGRHLHHLVDLQTWGRGLG